MSEGMSNTQQKMSDAHPRPSAPWALWKNRWFAFPVLIALLLGTAAACWLPYGNEILAFNNLRREPLNSAFRLATNFGEAYAYIIAGLTLLALRKYRSAALVAVTGLLVLPLSFILKDWFGSLRPLTWFTENGRWQEVVTVPGVELASGFTSFPSGHTLSAFALYSVLTLTLSERHYRWGLLFALLAILVGTSRVFLVQHYLVDVLCGAAVGLAVGSWAWMLGQRELGKAAV